MLVAGEELPWIDTERCHLRRIPSRGHLRFEIWPTKFAGEVGDLVCFEVSRGAIAEVFSDFRPAHHGLARYVGSGFDLAAQQVVHAVPCLIDREARALPRRLCATTWSRRLTGQTQSQLLHAFGHQLRDFIAAFAARERVGIDADVFHGLCESLTQLGGHRRHRCRKHLRRAALQFCGECAHQVRYGLAGLIAGEKLFDLRRIVKNLFQAIRRHLHKTPHHRHVSSSVCGL